MTLIEIIVALLIVVGLLSTVLVMTSLLTFSDIDKAASVLARTMQHVYGRAAINGTRYRLVLDLDNDTYWVECSDENPPVLDEEDQDDFARRFEGSDFYDFNQGLDRFGTREATDSEVEPYDPFNINLEGMFDDCSEDLIPLRLASGDDASEDGADARNIVIESVLTGHQREPSTTGRVEINFFPDGFVEPFYVWLAKAEEDDEPEEWPTATLTNEPMTGHVFIETRRLEVPENFAEVEEAR